ncbi:MAG: hypothetical protein AAF483_27490 [Planctomycetota bacterium]
MTYSKLDDELTAKFGELWQEAMEIWDEQQNEPAFEGYVCADYLAVGQQLASLRGKAVTFLEWGSGLGVVTIMASHMGFEAYGIEAERGLIEYSKSLTEKYGAEADYPAKFAQGSFIPDAFKWNPADGEELSRTIIDMPAAYDALDMELRDFDFVYAYPWPDEHTLFESILRQFARADVLWLSYDAREGTRLASRHVQDFEEM